MEGLVTQMRMGLWWNRVDYYSMQSSSCVFSNELGGACGASIHSIEVDSWTQLLNNLCISIQLCGMEKEHFRNKLVWKNKINILTATIFTLLLHHHLQQFSKEILSVSFVHRN